MPRRRNPLLQALVTGACIGYIRLTRLLPLSFNHFLAGILGRAAYYLVPRIRRVGLANLDLAYGDALSPAEKRRILRGAVANVARVAAEFSRMPAMAAQRFEGFVHIEGAEHTDLNKGCVFIGGHFGNWEWMAPAMGSHGYKVAEIVRPLDDPRLDRIVDQHRRADCVTTIPKNDAGREIFRLLKEDWFVGILIDQSPRENGVPVTFFGQPCWATIAPAMIAARSRMPIHPVSMLRGSDGRYTLRFYPAIDMVRSGNLHDDLQTNTQRCQDAFERIVRENPEQWLWFHRRWKTRPRLENEWNARINRENKP